MKTLSQRTLVAVLGTAISALLCVPAAIAGCGNPNGIQGTPVFRSLNANAANGNSANEQQSTDAPGPDHESIVGMWKFEQVSMGNGAHNPPIPDEVLLDFGYQQWHSDGTEITNSAGRAPATENFCLGVWTKIAPRTFRLNHFALSYDALTGVLNGKVRIQEQVILSKDGNQFTGTFSIDVFEPVANQHVDHLEGIMTGERLTVDSNAP
jgi:hypothetical protein